jgi:hypothetical protein
MKTQRPSHREIIGKLTSAKAAVSRGQMAFVNDRVIREDLLELDILVEDLPELLPCVLDELNPELYRGARPPQRSYEDTIKGCELYAFTWRSRAVGCDIYLKFALKNDWLWVVSFHRERKAKGGEPDDLSQ